MIAVREISKSFGSVRAVRPTSFALEPGQIAGLLGPNGAGKTTTIRMITGSLPPDTGTIEVDGHDVRTAPLAARGAIGYLPEAAPLYPEMRPEAYLHYRGRLFGMTRDARRDAIGRVMDRCGLGPMRGRRIGALSKGYRQRVGLAAALLHDPPALVLDEPTNGLDPSQIREARSLIRELAEDRTMLLCTHILPEVERTCDRVIVMGSGRVLADGDPSELVGSAPGPRRYAVEIRSNPSAGAGPVIAMIARMPGVAAVREAHDRPADAGAGWCRLEVESEPDAPDLREPIAGAAADNGFFVRELVRQRQTLEAMFVRLIEQARTEPDAEGARP